MVSLQLVKPELTTDLSQVLCQAQSRGYTKFGEMFSGTQQPVKQKSRSSERQPLSFFSSREHDQIPRARILG